MNDRARLARILFSADAFLGILSVGGAALYGAALSSGNAWVVFLKIFVPFSALWSLFCYGAYKGLTSEKIVLKLVFWSFVVGHVFAFPIGTAIAVVSIWLRRELREMPGFRMST